MIQSSRESIIDVSEMLDKCFLKAVLSKLYRPVKSVPGEALDERVIIKISSFNNIFLRWQRSWPDYSQSMG